MPANEWIDRHTWNAEPDKQSGFASRDEDMKFVALMATGLASAGAVMLSVPAHAAQKAVEIANPASTYCVSIGGTSFVRNTPSGAVGYCRLPNGKVEDEWTLFRNSQKPSPRRRNDAHMGNPAAIHCSSIGGTSLTRRTSRGDVALCRLRNGKTVDAWDLFRNANGKDHDMHPRNRRADMTNPAASYCIERKGTLEARQESGGTTTYCRLPDGRVVEQWKLFREQPNGRTR